MLLLRTAIAMGVQNIKQKKIPGFFSCKFYVKTK